MSQLGKLVPYLVICCHNCTLMNPHFRLLESELSSVTSEPRQASEEQEERERASLREEPAKSEASGLRTGKALGIR